MKTPPLVSIIVPAYNAELTLEETLNSILGQTYQAIEVIVVDDGSTDQTAEILKRYEPSIIHIHQINSGSCAVPRNTGLQNCKGDLVCFIDADDLFRPGHIARSVSFLEQHPDIGLVFSNYRNFDQNGPYSQSHFQTCPKLMFKLGNARELIIDDPLSLLADENFGIAGSIMLRREMLQYASGFEPTLRACEDFHFYYRLARHTSIGVINEVGMDRRLHNTNMSGDATRMLTQGVRAYGMLLQDEKNLPARKSLHRYISSCWLDLANLEADSGRYWNALDYCCRSLYHTRSFVGLHFAIRGLLRTFVMAIGLHQPASR